MFKTIEPKIDEHGNVPLARTYEAVFSANGDTALLSEPALANDWHSREEDEAWSFLQRKQ